VTIMHPPKLPPGQGGRGLANGSLFQQLSKTRKRQVKAV
jgi:hypothetical protein